MCLEINHEEGLTKDRLSYGKHPNFKGHFVKTSFVLKFRMPHYNSLVLYHAYMILISFEAHCMLFALNIPHSIFLVLHLKYIVLCKPRFGGVGKQSLTIQYVYDRNLFKACVFVGTSPILMVKSLALKAGSYKCGIT